MAPDANWTCALDSGGGDCTCACYNPATDSYCGACDENYQIPCAVNGTVPVCRESWSGHATSVNAYVFNPDVSGVLCGGIDLPDCDAVFAQLLAALMADANLTAILSDASCEAV
jgi:hypothetical protein